MFEDKPFSLSSERETITRKILLVDDESAILRTYKRFLNDAGYPVETADTYEAALDAVKNEAFNLVVADIIMGGNTGIDLLGFIRTHCSNLPVVLITGKPDVRYAVESVRLGAYDFLIKPVEKHQLIRVVNRAVEHKRLFEDKERLQEQNERYRKELERLVRKRSEALEEIARKYRNERNIREKTEKEIAVRDQQLLQADKLSALGILVSGMTHEINNPMGVIAINIPIIADIWTGMEPVLGAYQKKHGDFHLRGLSYEKIKERVPFLFRQTMESVRQIQSIINDLKRFYREEADPEKSVIDLSEVVNTSVSLVNAMIRKSTDRFHVFGSEAPVPVWGRFQQLEQVMVNILINACEALPDRSRSISASVFSETGRNHAVIRVEDEGVGIPPEVLQHIFEPFFTTKREKGGTGLGLSVSYRIIREHDGEIIYHPGKNGVGTRCEVVLPLATETGSNDRESVDNAETAAAGATEVPLRPRRSAEGSA